jgi:hypothetical protein
MLEKLVLDMVKLQDDRLACEVSITCEFAPVKNEQVVDSVDSTRELFRMYSVEF